MPDSVEQSRDANERVCLREGLETTVVERLNSAEEHSFRDRFLRRLATEAPGQRNVIHVEKNNIDERYDCFFTCVNDIKFPRIKKNGWKHTFNLHQNRPLLQRM